MQEIRIQDVLMLLGQKEVELALLRAELAKLRDEKQAAGVAKKAEPPEPKPLASTDLS